MGKVYLVGAGPGDPELLTLRAARLLKHASVVVHDRLAPEEIIAYANSPARFVYAAKQPGRQEETQCDSRPSAEPAAAGLGSATTPGEKLINSKQEAAVAG